jgi:membrane-bound ClpP family serine protease
MIAPGLILFIANTLLLVFNLSSDHFGLLNATGAAFAVIGMLYSVIVMQRALDHHEP